LPHFEQSYAERWFSNFGPAARQFEAALTERFCHRNEIITSASSATSGIAAALIARDVQGSVVVPAYTFPATGAAALMAGAEPAVIDVALESWIPSPDRLEQIVSSQKVAAVVLVSPFGIRQDFSAHLSVCLERQIPVVVDSAAGLGTRTVPLPDASCFEVYSLHATKAFPIGEGGAVRSRASEAGALRRALNFGLEAGAAIPGCWGINGKLSEISAAIGLAVLSEFEAVVRHRQSVAAQYIECLRRFPDMVFPTDPERAPWQVFPVLLPSAGAAEKFMQRAGAESLQIRWSYRPTLDNWPRTRSCGDCANARLLSERMVTLPVYSDMTEDELGEILGIVQRSLDDALSA
jgi:dTDP-4-amino-4,6-dideoxygalactose transaminase